ncbi:restriction endonuclease subunit S [Microbispora bryophytorum]|uniref:restriction endonuclease subunit S n=1 Tax=Microbispora bryophytorum TaxID=1460882 RepID=UPI003714197C
MIQWYPALPTGWQHGRVKSVAHRVTDGAHISPDTEGGVYDFVSTRDVKQGQIDFAGSLKTTPETYKYMVKTGCQPFPGDVLFSKDGTVGETAIVRVRKEFVVASSLVIVSPRQEVMNSDFLAYVFASKISKDQAASLMRGAGLPRLSVGNLARVEVPIPPLAEQQSIVGFLDHETAQIDALVAKQEEFIEFLRERRRAAIEVAVSEVGMSGPRLKHIIRSVRQGWSPQCYSWPADGIDSWAILKVGAVNGGVFRPTENKKLPAEEAPRPEAVVQRGDLIVSRANTRDLVGSAAVVEGDFPRLMLSDKLYAFTLNEDQALPQFVAAVLGSRKWRDLIEMQATGASSSMLNISQSDIVNLPMTLPPVEEQRRILTHLDDQTARIDALIAKAQEHIAFAKERRVALITAVVAGQLNVGTARKAG